MSKFQVGDVWANREGVLFEILKTDRYPPFTISARACADNYSRSFTEDGYFMANSGPNVNDLITLISRAPVKSIAAEILDTLDTTRQQVASLCDASAHIGIAAHIGSQPALCDTPAADDGYALLRDILASAVDQASHGKGRERHANGRPFDRQPIMEIGRMLSSVCDGELYQVIKKAQEASGMISRGELDAAERELFGVINYAGAAILLVREHKEQG